MASTSGFALERTIQVQTILGLNAGYRTLVRCRSADAVGHVVGDPDITGCIDGCHVEIEVKNSVGKPTKKQWYELRKWAHAGAYCAITTTKAEALAFQQEVLAKRGEGCILAFGKAAQQVRQGSHGGGYEVPIAACRLGDGDEKVVEERVWAF